MTQAAAPAVSEWPGFLRSLAAIERAWVLRGPDRAAMPPGYVPWIPLLMHDFLPLLLDAVAAMPPGRPSFLDVGCGPGTKAALAARLFGLDACGIDVVPEFTGAARQLGVKAETADAREWDRYGEAGIVYLNRPVSGPGRHEVAAAVTGGMAPGAVLITVNGAARPGDAGWELVAEEAGMPHGVWRKPDA